jgi:hypothetical protein
LSEQLQAEERPYRDAHDISRPGHALAAGPAYHGPRTLIWGGSGVRGFYRRGVGFPLLQHRNLLPPWKPGQSGNPLGRPKGSRNKLAEQFFIDDCLRTLGLKSTNDPAVLCLASKIMELARVYAILPIIVCISAAEKEAIRDAWPCGTN